MNEQYTLFKEMVNQVEKPNYIHCQNSAGSLPWMVNFVMQ